MRRRTEIAVPASGVELGPRLAGPACPITQHHRGFRFVGQRTRPDMGVPGVFTTGSGQLAVGDDPGVRFDCDVHLQAILLAVNRIVRVPRCDRYSNPRERVGHLWVGIGTTVDQPVEVHPSMVAIQSDGQQGQQPRPIEILSDDVADLVMTAQAAMHR